MLPTQWTPPFTIASGGTSTVATASTSDGLFRLVSGPTSVDALSYQLNNSSSWNGLGDSTVETSLRIAGGGETSTAQTLRLLTGVRDIQLHFRTTGISLQGGSSYSIDTTVFHVYRVVVRAGIFVEVYVDGGPTPVLTRIETAGTTLNRLRFGDVTASGFGDVYWDYIRWTNTGAYAPNPPPFTPIVDDALDAFGSTKINNTRAGGREYAATSWFNCTPRVLHSGVRDPFDAEVKARGNGTLAMDGRGLVTLSGDSPRLYVYDEPGELPLWNNVEVTYYARRVSESTPGITFRGFTVGARSDHHLQSDVLPDPCTHTYYARAKLTGDAQFLKESRHPDGYSQPVATNDLGEVPVGQWTGYKFVLKNINDDRFVKMELYRDLTMGADGGTWEPIAEFVDDGTNLDTNGIACGSMLTSLSPLLDPGHSVFLRADFMTADYSRLTIREIEPDPDQGKPCVPCPDGVAVAPYNVMLLTLDARRSYQPTVAQPAQQCACLVRNFVIPSELHVTEGNAGKHHTDFTFTDASTGATATCKYKGASSKMHPRALEDIDAGLRYELSECDNGQLAGEVARASYFRLSVQGGNHEAGPTAVSLPLPLFK
ncbi:MAG TPA: hypothetical protein VIV11_22425 [Kofleriaceae bacterium]